MQTVLLAISDDIKEAVLYFCIHFPNNPRI